MKEIIVVGLGPGGLEHLSLGAWQTLKTGKNIYFRTARHPVVQDLAALGISFATFDSIYEHKASFQEVYEEIAEELINLLNADTAMEQVIYGVPGHPLLGEESVLLLLEKGPQCGIRITIKAGMSFIDALYGPAGLNPALGYLILDAMSVTAAEINPLTQTVFYQVYSRMLASDLKLLLLAAYPYNHPVVVIRGAGIPAGEKIVRLPLHELDHLDWFDHLTSVYVGPLPERTGQLAETGQPEGIEQPEEITLLERPEPPERSYSLDPLVKVMERLLSPDGCPWDRQQSHCSIKTYLLEEAYEVIEAIDDGDMHKLCEELGDLLLQVVFHSALAKNRGDFDSNDVIRTVTQKMIRRHPHVFADTKVQDSDEVLVNWEQIKAKERGVGSDAESVAERVMDRLNKALPALMLAEEVQKKAKRVGFDWPDLEGAWGKISEEIDELKAVCEVEANCEAEAAGRDSSKIEEELGDLLFAVVNVARFLKVPPETALLKSVRKFMRRFNYIEQEIVKNNIKWSETDLGVLDELWKKAKEVGL